MSYHIKIPSDDRGSRFNTIRLALRDLCQVEKRTIEEIVTDIEALAPALIQLAMQAE